MADSLLRKYTKLSAAEDPTLRRGNSDSVDVLPCFGVLRGIRDRSFMLELRKKSGAVLAVSYSALEVEFEPDKGIKLFVPGRIIEIKGLRLNLEETHVGLLSGIVRQRISWIREVSRSESLDETFDGPLVESITWDG